MLNFLKLLVLFVLGFSYLHCVPKKDNSSDQLTSLFPFLLNQGNTLGASSSAPTITKLTPTSGNVGTTVTITGTNFSSTIANNTVKFNGVTATISKATFDSLEVTVPTGATSGSITVTVGADTGTSTSTFTVTSIRTSCSTNSSSPSTLTLGTSAVDTLANGDVCYYTFTPTFTDIFYINLNASGNSSTSSNVSDVDLYVSYGDSSITGNPVTTSITATSSISSNSDWAAYSQRASSSIEFIKLHSMINVAHIIAVHGKNCTSQIGCTFILSTSAASSSVTTCEDIDTSTFSTAAIVETGATVAGRLTSTKNCVYRLSMKQTTTNSYSLTGLTRDLDLYLASLGSNSTTPEFTSVNGGTTNEAINTKTSSAGSFRFVQVSPVVTCSTGSSCSFSVGITSP